jgi:hypothetical protein
LLRIVGVCDPPPNQPLRWLRLSLLSALSDSEPWTDTCECRSSRLRLLVDAILDVPKSGQEHFRNDTGLLSPELFTLRRTLVLRIATGQYLLALYTQTLSRDVFQLKQLRRIPKTTHYLSTLPRPGSFSVLSRCFFTHSFQYFAQSYCTRKHHLHAISLKKPVLRYYRGGAPRDTKARFVYYFAISDYRIGTAHNIHRVNSTIYRHEAWQGGLGLETHGI